MSSVGVRSFESPLKQLYLWAPVVTGICVFGASRWPIGETTWTLLCTVGIWDMAEQSAWSVGNSSQTCEEEVVFIQSSHWYI